MGQSSLSQFGGYLLRVVLHHNIGLGFLLSLAGFALQSISSMSSSISVSNFSRFLLLSSGLGELVLAICWVAVSSQSDSDMHRHQGHFNTQVGQYGPTKFGGHSGCLEVSSCPVPSLMFKPFNAIVAWESFIGSFSLSELVLA